MYEELLLLLVVLLAFSFFNDESGSLNIISSQLPPLNLVMDLLEEIWGECFTILFVVLLLPAGFGPWGVGPINGVVCGVLLARVLFTEPFLELEIPASGSWKCCCCCCCSIAFNAGEVNGENFDLCCCCCCDSVACMNGVF